MGTTRLVALDARVASVLASLILLFLAACGGSALGPSLNSPQVWPAHGWDGGAKAGSYVAVAIDAAEQVLPELTAKLQLSVEAIPGGERVRIRAHDLGSCDYVGMHLRYDGQRLHPTRTQCGRGLEGRTLFLGVTNMPGAVALGVTTINGAPVLAGDVDLAEVEFANGRFMGERHLSLANNTPVNDLAFDPGTPGLLRWSYNAPGDADQNSLVAVADIVPLGIHYGKTSAAPDWAAARVADTKPDGVINVADLTPIGIHFQEHVTGYQVLSCPTEVGQYNPIAGALVLFADGVIPGGGGFKQFSHLLAAPAEGEWYSVIAMEGANMAANHSNAQQYSAVSVLPPVNLQGASDGTNIQLAWDPPTGPAPDSYDAFLSNNSDMSSPVKLNATPVLATLFTVDTLYPPTTSYYFAAVAVYGATSSAYSNIFHYAPAGTAPPENLHGASDGTNIQLAWDPPTGPAPDSYDVFLSNSSDMSSPVQLNAAPVLATIYSVDTLYPPTSSYYFAIVAIFGANSSAYSNIFHYVPAGTAPPVNLRGASDGTNIQLAWDPPTGPAPDSYDVFLSNSSDMSGALKLNAAPVTNTLLTVPALFPPTNSYYFAATAVYGASSSAYSNIYHYIPGGDAPQNLVASHVGDHIQLDWQAPASGAPDGYNAYIGTNDTLSDAFKINPALIVGLTFDVSTLFSPDQIHYFGVKASTGLMESGFSNIYMYDPGAGPDILPPVWQGADGIQSVAPDDQVVSVTWTAAIDAKTPPVEYLLYYVQDPQEFDWNAPNEIYAAGITSTNVIGLTNGVRYKFAVRARDSVAPTPNVTTNVNFLYGTPMVFPADGAISTILASDVASVRMPGEELPRVAAVNHTAELWYGVYNGTDWQATDLNTIIANPDRKYHPQMVGVGADVHIVYATASGVFEIYGPKDDDPATWTQKTIVAGGLNGVFGIGFDYSDANSYFAVVYATKTGTEQLYYADRNAGGSWNAPISLMAGNPEIWQCDLALNEFDGSQWAVFASGTANSSGDNLKFYFLHRDSRMGIWAGGPTGYGGDVMVVDIDPSTQQPLVVDAEERDYDTGYGIQPLTDATVFAWDGSTWLKTPPLEQGDCLVDLGSGTMETILTGQDPQLVFSPAGKAVALWTKLDFMVYIFDDTADLTGDWRYSQRIGTTWASTKSMMIHITSSNSVTAGDGYQHCITCDLGLSDSGVTQDIVDKYSARNDYVEGDLWYHRQAW